MNALYVWGSETNNPKQATHLRITAYINRPMSVFEYFSDGSWTGSTAGNELFTTDAENKAIYKASPELLETIA